MVRESQAAVFLRDGKALDVFGPGRHTLSTLNLPLVGRLVGTLFGGNTPFHAEVVFVSTRLITDVKWGTRSPVPMRDAELGLVRVRAFGSSSLRVTDPGLFVNTLVAQRSRFTTEDIVEFLKDAIIARLADVLGENMKSIFDLAALYDEISAAAKARTKVDFEKLGLELVDFYINAVTPPEEVQKKIDERAGMAALGDTEEAQRRLYALNDTTDRDTLGADGSPSWASFEDFQQSVCRADWYRPAGQRVVIDTATGDWAAMSAISRFDDYAYNLHTGVDRRYRGRQLAQAVKVLALRYARDELHVAAVRTHHNSRNLPMIAIDRKLGYVQTPGTWLLEKTLS